MICQYLCVPISVFLVDDHEVVRQGLRYLLEAESDITIVGEASSVGEAAPRILATQPNVAVLDVRLPDGDGIELCREIRSSNPEIACLMLTSYSDDEALVASVLAGAAGYVLKNVKGNDLVSSIRTASQGKSLVGASETQKVLEHLRAGDKGPSKTEDGLTPQENKILELIAKGFTNKQIGVELFLAEKTVKNYVSNMLTKLGMSRRTEAAVYAVERNRAKKEPRETP